MEQNNEKAITSDLNDSNQKVDITPTKTEKVAGNQSEAQKIDFFDLSDEYYENENDLGKGYTKVEETEIKYDLSQEIPQKEVKVENPYERFQWFNGRMVEKF